MSKVTERNKAGKPEVAVCQECRMHSSKPSTCHFYNKFVGRKEASCENFKGKRK